MTISSIKKIASVIHNNFKVFCIPSFSLFLITNTIINDQFNIPMIPHHELLALIFTLVLLINVESIIIYLDTTNFNFFSKYFNYWVSIFFLILKRATLVFILLFFAYLTIEMICMEFKFGTIFGAKTRWEYSWLLKIPILVWVFLIGFYSITSFKSKLYPFSLKPKK